MFFSKSKAIKERASYLYRLMYKENTEIEITRNGFYDNVFTVSAYVGGKHYQAHFSDCQIIETFGMKYNKTIRTNSLKIAQYFALNIARIEYNKLSMSYYDTLSASLSLA